jgi:hypothetical protein
MVRSWRQRVTENIGLVVAIAAATIALWSAKIQRDALQLDERPYLKVSFERIEPKRDQRHPTPSWSGYDAHAVVEVSGKTPAFNVSARGSCVPEHLLDKQGTDNGLTWRLWPFLFNEKQTLNCHVEHDLPNGDLPRNVPFNLTIQYDDIFKRHHLTTFCEVIITSRGEGPGGEELPRPQAIGTIECDNFKFQMN